MSSQLDKKRSHVRIVINWTSWIRLFWLNYTYTRHYFFLYQVKNCIIYFGDEQLKKKKAHHPSDLSRIKQQIRPDQVPHKSHQSNSLFFGDTDPHNPNHNISIHSEASVAPIITQRKK